MPGKRPALAHARTRAERICRNLAVDPVEVLALITKNELPCGTCRGTLRTKYALPQGQHTRECPGDDSCSCNGIGTRICQSCFGDGRENCPPELRAYTAQTLAKYLYPQFKSIEDKNHNAAKRIPLQIVIVNPADRQREISAAEPIYKDVIDAED